MYCGNGVRDGPEQTPTSSKWIVSNITFRMFYKLDDWRLQPTRSLGKELAKRPFPASRSLEDAFAISINLGRQFMDTITVLDERPAIPVSRPTRIRLHTHRQISDQKCEKTCHQSTHARPFSFAIRQPEGHHKAGSHLLCNPSLRKVMGTIPVQKKSAFPLHALTRSPTTGKHRIHEETMRPDGRIITYMPFCV